MTAREAILELPRLETERQRTSAKRTELPGARGPRFGRASLTSPCPPATGFQLAENIHQSTKAVVGALLALLQPAFGRARPAYWPAKKDHQ